MSDSLSDVSNNSMEPDCVTLNSIHSVLKEILKENKAKNKSLEDLVKRVSRIENDRHPAKRKATFDPTSTENQASKKSFSNVNDRAVESNYVTGPNQIISVLDTGDGEFICEIPSSSAEFIQPSVSYNPVISSGKIVSPQINHGSRHAIPTMCSGVSTRARSDQPQHVIPVNTSGVNAGAFSVQSPFLEPQAPSINTEGGINVGASTSHESNLLGNRENNFEGFLLEDSLPSDELNSKPRIIQIQFLVLIPYQLLVLPLRLIGLLMKRLCNGLQTLLILISTMNKLRIFVKDINRNLSFLIILSLLNFPLPFGISAKRIPKMLSNRDLSIEFNKFLVLISNL